MRKVFVDYHHTSLLRSLILLFHNRLGMDVYRPIGMEWFEEGYWGINDQKDTAEQFLSLDQAYVPGDGTPPLNKIGDQENGIYTVVDPGGTTNHQACTLEYFKNNKFDFVVASIPAHIPMFEALIAKYQPEAKLIVQMGNMWPDKLFSGYNVLASVKPRVLPANTMFYHQEFDLKIFSPSKAEPTRNIYSFVNVIKNMDIAWQDYKALKRILKSKGYKFKSFGGQCPDGNMNGPNDLAVKMREAELIFHVKPGGDGFGHIIHNAYAVGRPVITRKSHYHNQLAEELMVPGTFIDLDQHSIPDVANMIVRLTHSPDKLAEMGRLAAQRFDEVVDYVKEAKEIYGWLERLN